MSIDLHAPPRLGQLAIGRDEEGRPDDAFDLLAVHHLLPPSAVGTVRLQFGIAEEAKSDSDLLLESAVALHRVLRDAHHLATELLQARGGLREALRLTRAAGRVVLRVEIEDEPLAREVLGGDPLVGVTLEVEPGGSGAFG